MRVSVALTLGLLALCACRETPTDPWTSELPEGAVQLVVDSARNAAFVRATRTIPPRTNLVTRAQIVVRDQQAWEALWLDMTVNGGRGDGPPPVDFESEMVIAVAIGRTPPPSDRVAIAGVMTDGTNLYTLVLVGMVEPGCVDTRIGPELASTTPVALALVPARPGTPQVLERRVHLTSC